MTARAAEKPFIVKPLSESVVSELLYQTALGATKGESYLTGMTRFTRLVELELQQQVCDEFARRAKRQTERLKAKENALAAMTNSLNYKGKT